MQCAEILVLLLVIIVSSEESVDSVDVWMEGTDLWKSWSILNSNGTCQCATRYYLIRWPPSSTKAVPHSIRQPLLHMCGLCPFNHLPVRCEEQFVTDISVLNINHASFMCGPLNRTGVLCSQCKEGLGPALLNYSYSCLKCSGYNWASYFTATLDVLSLEYMVPLYPFLCIIALYVVIEMHARGYKALVVLWKPFLSHEGLEY